MYYIVVKIKHSFRTFMPRSAYYTYYNFQCSDYQPKFVVAPVNSRCLLQLTTTYYKTFISMLRLINCFINRQLQNVVSSNPFWDKFYFMFF